MKQVNRDLLLLTKRAAADEKELELEVENLHKLLYLVESLENFCTVTEIIDIVNYKIIDKASKIDRIIRHNKLKPFQFINNKN